MAPTSPATAERRQTAAGKRAARATCPFCALLCDDLVPGTGANANALPVLPAGAVCAKASDGFARAAAARSGAASASPQVGGRDVALAEALDAAAAIITAARLPLYGGLATDVDGMRGLLELADRSGGVVDHALSAGAMRNVAVIQSRGWVMTTLTEVRNRADLVVVIGDGIGASYPRFYERIVGPSVTMFGELSRTVVLVGNGADRDNIIAPNRCEAMTVAPQSLGVAVAALRAAIRGTPMPPRLDAVGLGAVGPDAVGMSAAAIAKLAGQITAATYPVFVWSPGLLPDADGDLIVMSICDLVRDLNATQRAAGLSLSGSEGGATAMAVTAWQTGYPMRVSLATGIPVYDPLRFDIAAMLAGGDGDALVWSAAIGAGLTPPSTKIPTIVLGTPGLALNRTPDVFIPVGTPGIDHDGDLVRSDSAVAIHLRRARASTLPPVARIARDLSGRLATPSSKTDV